MKKKNSKSYDKQDGMGDTRINGMGLMNSMNYMMFGFCNHDVDPVTKICNNCKRDFQ